MFTQFRFVALALAAGGLTVAAPAAAAPAFYGTPAVSPATYGIQTLNYGDRYDRYDRYDRREARRYEREQRRYARQWRGDDGRYYCRKSDGTTGLIVGGAAGALLGREVAGRGDRTLGAILGAAGGALLGKSIDSKVTCR